MCKTSVITMQQNKKSVTARIPQDLYDKCNQQYANMTDAVIAGLELLCNTDYKTSVINNELLNKEKDKKPNTEVLQLYDAQIKEKDFRITDLQAHNETLKKEL